MDSNCLILMAALILLFFCLWSMWNNNNSKSIENFSTYLSYPYYQTTCTCAGVADENLCTQCSNCTWEIGADGTGRCIPYYNYGYNWWNPMSWYGTYSYPYYSDYSYTYPYYGSGLALGGRRNGWNTWGRFSQ